jgi:hypothetical protein
LPLLPLTRSAARTSGCLTRNDNTFTLPATRLQAQFYPFNDT